MKKRVTKLIMTSFLGLSVMLGGCGQSASSGTGNNGNPSAQPQDDKVRVAVVFKALNNDFWKIMEAGVKDAAEKLGVEVAVLAPAAETEVEKQISIIEDQIAKKVDALVVAPSQPATVIPAFEKAKQDKIPVILVDSDADFPDKVTFIGTGNRAAGKQAGEYLSSRLSPGDKVAIIRGALGDNTHDERTAGAEEAMKAAGITIAAVQPADSDREKAYSVMQNILQTNPDLKAVFATSDAMALGALRAVQESKSDTMVVGFDGEPDALKAIERAELAASVAQDPYRIGYLGVEAAVKAIQGEAVENRIDSGATVITKENVAEQMKKLNEILN